MWCVTVFKYLSENLAKFEDYQPMLSIFKFVQFNLLNILILFLVPRSLFQGTQYSELLNQGTEIQKFNNLFSFLTSCIIFDSLKFKRPLGANMFSSWITILLLKLNNSLLLLKVFVSLFLGFMNKLHKFHYKYRQEEFKK